MVAEAALGDAAPDNRAVRIIDDNAALTTTMVCDYPSSDEKHVSFTFSPARYTADFTFGIRGSTPGGAVGTAWWFGLRPIAGSGDVQVNVFDGSAWQQLGRAEGFGTPGELRPVTLSVNASVAEITVGDQTFITDLRREETVDLDDVLFSSAGRSSVGMELYIDDLAVGSELPHSPAGVQFLEAVSWLSPVAAGETPQESRLVSFRPMGGPAEETFEATVDWGSGAEPATVTPAEQEGQFDIHASHPYREVGVETVDVSVSGSSGTSGRLTLTIKVEERSVVAVEPEGLAPRFPSVIRLDDGRLLVAYYSGSGHVDPQGHIRISESHDNGQTWSEPRTIVASEFDNRDPKLTQLSDGTILLNYFITNWEDPAARRQLGTHVVRSEDGGQTWSDPIRVDTQMSCAQPPPPGGCSMDDGWSAMHGPIVELANGDLLNPLYGVSPAANKDVLVNVYDGSAWRQLGRVDGFGTPGELRPVTLAVNATGAEITVGDQTFVTGLRRDETINVNDIVFSSGGRTPVGMEFYVDDLAVASAIPPPIDTEVRTFEDEPLGEPPTGCTAPADAAVAAAPFGDAGPANRAVRLLDDSATLTTTVVCDYPSSDEKHVSFAFSPERFGADFIFGVRGDTASGGTGNAWWFALTPASPRQRATVVRSTDGGLSWDGHNEATIAVGDDGVQFQEPNLTVLPDGEIVAGVRTNATGGVLYISRSFDDGHTWSPAEPTDIPASSHDQVLRDDGSVLVTYGHLGIPNRPTAGVLVSDASGDWSGHHKIPIYDSGDGDQANPSSIEIEPGLFMTLGYDIPARTLYGIYTKIEDYRDPAMNLAVTPATDLTVALGDSLHDVALAEVVDAWGNPPVSLTGNIDWGDGTEATSGAVTEAGGEHVVTGSHLYDRPGTFEITATVTDRTQTQAATLEIEVACPEPDERETVVLGDIDSGVPNRLVTHGCTVNDLINAEREWDSHADFVRHIGDVADELTAQGVLDGRERGTLIRAAANSDVGK